MYQHSVYDRIPVKEMLEIFGPFEEATDNTQKQTIDSASLVIPCIRGVNFHLNLMESMDNSMDWLQDLRNL